MRAGVFPRHGRAVLLAVEDDVFTKEGLGAQSAVDIVGPRGDVPAIFQEHEYGLSLAASMEGLEAAIHPGLLISAIRRAYLTVEGPAARRPRL